MRWDWRWWGERDLNHLRIEDLGLGFVGTGGFDFDDDEL